MFFFVFQYEFRKLYPWATEKRKKYLFNNVFIGVRCDKKKNWYLILGFSNQISAKLITVLSLWYGNTSNTKQIKTSLISWINYFATTGRDIFNFFHSTEELPQDMQSIAYSILFGKVSPIHIESVISSWKNKACHISSYPAKTLKCVRHIVSPILSRLVNKSLNLGVFPNSLKTDSVIHLLKNGTTTSLTN